MADQDTTDLAAQVSAAADALEEWNGPDGSLVLNSIIRKLRLAVDGHDVIVSTPEQLAKAERRGATTALSRLDDELALADQTLRMIAVQHANGYDVLGLARVEGRRAANQGTRMRIAAMSAEVSRG